MAKKVDSRGMPLKTYDSHRRVASTSFAAVLLIIVGVFHLLQGFGALLSDADFTTSKGYSLGSDGSKWGWAHLALGVAAIAAGVALRQRADWARGVAVIVATVEHVRGVPVDPVPARSRRSSSSCSTSS